MNNMDPVDLYQLTYNETSTIAQCQWNSPEEYGLMDNINSLIMIILPGQNKAQQNQVHIYGKYYQNFREI